jgi:hypothetical protein
MVRHEKLVAREIDSILPEKDEERTIAHAAIRPRRAETPTDEQSDDPADHTLIDGQLIASVQRELENGPAGHRAEITQLDAPGESGTEPEETPEATRVDLRPLALDEICAESEATLERPAPQDETGSEYEVTPDPSGCPEVESKRPPSHRKVVIKETRRDGERARDEKEAPAGSEPRAKGASEAARAPEPSGLRVFPSSAARPAILATEAPILATKAYVREDDQAEPGHRLDRAAARIKAERLNRASPDDFAKDAETVDERAPPRRSAWGEEAPRKAFKRGETIFAYLPRSLAVTDSAAKTLPVIIAVAVLLFTVLLGVKMISSLVERSDNDFVSVTLKPLGEPVPISSGATLPMVTLETEPAGIVIVLDRKVLGPTPLTFEAPIYAERIELLLTSPQYEPFKVELWKSEFGEFRAQAKLVRKR